MTYPEAESQQPCNFHFEGNFMKQVSIIQKWETTVAEAATFT